MPAKRDIDFNNKKAYGLKSVTLKDQDATPVGDLLLKDVDQVLRVRDSGDQADKSVAVSSVPDLPASKITSGAFDLARIPTPLTGKDADSVDGVHLPATIASVLSDHDKAVHDALAINADLLDSLHAAAFALAGHTHTSFGALSLSGDLSIALNKIVWTNFCIREAYGFAQFLNPACTGYYHVQAGGFNIALSYGYRSNLNGLWYIGPDEFTKTSDILQILAAKGASFLPMIIVASGANPVLTLGNASSTSDITLLNPVSLSSWDPYGVGISATIRNTAVCDLSFAKFVMRSGLGNEGGEFFGSQAALDAYGIVNGVTFGPGTNAQDIGFRVGAALGGLATGPTMIIKADGKIGINQKAPSNAVHVFAPSAVFNSFLGGISVYASDLNDTNVGGMIRFGGRTVGFPAGYPLAAIKGAFENASDFRGFLAFATSLADGTINEKMRLTAAGYLGINKTDPGYVLDVGGDIHLTGDHVVPVKDAIPSDTPPVGTMRFVRLAANQNRIYVYTADGWQWHHFGGAGLQWWSDGVPYP